MIALHMDRPDFENDIRALLMSFFFGEKIVSDAQALKMKPEHRSFEHEFSFLHRGDAAFIKISSADGRQDQALIEGPGADRRADRDRLKTQVYRLLSSYTGQMLPWGTLTGVRPTKIPMEKLEQGFSQEEAAFYMEETYLVSPEKAWEAAEVARRELGIMRKICQDRGLTYIPGLPLPGFSLYVGIPFCPSICAYCSFSSYPVSVWEKRVDEYIDALIREINSVPARMRRPSSFYMGGGTPTSLTASQLDRVLSALDEHFDMASCPEKTVEAGRPDSIDRDKLRVMKKHGIDRISINPQTMKQETLDMIGRRHRVEDIVNACRLAREEGFADINMDLITGLPGENAEDMRQTMEKVCALGPESITVHSLALKRAAFLNQNREKFPVPSQDETRSMADISRSYAMGAGLVPYYLYRQKNIAANLENVGYAREGSECRYNMIIMEEVQSIVALGCGSISKKVFPGFRIERCANVKSVDDYIRRIDEMIGRKAALFEE